MLIRPFGSKGFALPLVLTTSALLLLSSLSLQTLALHARQRSSQALATAQTRDAELSVAMAFQQHAAGVPACLPVGLALLGVGELRALPWSKPWAAPIRPRCRSRLATAGLATPRRASWNAATPLE